MRAKSLIVTKIYVIVTFNHFFPHKIRRNARKSSNVPTLTLTLRWYVTDGVLAYVDNNALECEFQLLSKSEVKREETTEKCTF